MSETYMLAIGMITKSIFSYLLLYKVMALKITEKTRKQTFLFGIFLCFLFFGNLLFYDAYSWETELGTQRYVPDIREDIAVIATLLLVYRENIWKSIYYAVYGYVCVLLAELMMFVFDYIFLEQLLHYVCSISEMAVLEFSKIVLYFLIFQIMKRSRDFRYEIEDEHWRMFGMLGILVFAYFYYILQIVPTIDPGNGLMYTSMEFIQLCAMVAAFLLLGRYHAILGKKNRDLRDTKLLLQGEEFQMKLRNELSQANEKNRKLRHDLKHHFAILEKKVAEDPQYAMEYVKELTEHMEVISYVNTGNEVLNYIVNTKATKAQQLGIRFECHIEDSLSFLNDFDLISLLGNALDNAIEAQKYVEDPWISIDIISLGEKVAVRIENAYDSATTQKIENVFTTTAQ